MQKAVLLTALLCLLCSASLGAQERRGVPVRFGVKAGMNSSSYTLSRTRYAMQGLSLQPIQDIYAGVLAEREWPSALYGSLALQYSVKGFKATYDAEGMSARMRMHYVSLPVRVGYKYPLSGAFSLLAEGGLTPSYLVKAGATVSDPSGTSERADVTQQNLRFDLGAGVSAGIEFQEFLRLTAGFEWGLLPSNAAGESLPLYNRLFSIGLTFFFP